MYAFLGIIGLGIIGLGIIEHILSREKQEQLCKKQEQRCEKQEQRCEKQEQRELRDYYIDRDVGTISYTNPSRDSHSHSTTTTRAPILHYPVCQSSSSSSSTSPYKPLMQDCHENQTQLKSSNNSTPSLSRPLPQNQISSKQPQQPSFIKPPTSSSSKKAKILLPTAPSPLSSSNPSSRSKPSLSKFTLSPLPSDPSSSQTTANYVQVQKGTSNVYVIPENIKDLIKKDIVPEVLKKPVSPSTYADYFAALLYAEDFYIEKWSKFQLENVSLDIEAASIFEKSTKNKLLDENREKEEKTFVALKIDSVREKRPFLLSRDFVFVRPSGRNVEPFQGIIHRVEKSTLVLVEFGSDFHSQHRSTHKYDVSFSFNRVCLTRAHKAVEAASDPLFRNFTFPDCTPKDRFVSPPVFYFNNELDRGQQMAIRQICCLKAPPPYLVKGSLCVANEQLSRIGSVVQEAVLRIYNASPKSRILICAPTNKTCDLLMRSFKVGILESDMFRANAAFREIDGVPIDILPSCVYKEECFACPSLQELRDFRVILSTFVSSFRLRNEGITAGHFSHIFLVDASSATEPETMIALSNLADEKTVVVVTGASGNSSGWVRSEIARQRGLKISYFERLCKREPYDDFDSMFVSCLNT